jgi:dCTP deaminase
MANVYHYNSINLTLMILVDWQIKKEVKSGRLKIEPYKDELVQPNSIDVRLADEFIVYSAQDIPYVIDPYKKHNIEITEQPGLNIIIEKITSKSFLIKPGQFVLAATLEYFELPDDIVASIEGKSSLARLGLAIHSTGGWIDAGFRGTITLEMTNVNKYPIRLHAYMPIGQVVFYKTEHADVPYYEKHDAKYLGQVSPTLSRYYENPQ